jgi:hypothetical protein
MTELQQEPPRKQNGGESADASREITEATDEELSAAIAGIELEDDARSGSNPPSSDEDSDDLLLGFEDDEPEQSLDIGDKSDRTLDLETDEPDRPLGVPDRRSEHTLDLDGESDDATRRDTATDGSTDTPSGGLRALFARII